MTKKFVEMIRGVESSCPEGFFELVRIYSNGKDFVVDIPQWLTPLLNERGIDGCCDCLRDTFYRLHPELRKQ